ncbi:lytic transglycosylase domain-containing protein [Lutibacter sp.]|uniref:lytic transglycosylase domain-containing protein n=1 Tax=Lutibacter sp. TaxID=1925666 RepID=UPI0025B8AC74|nr:lytic transglycosylase domain-containing protein [Lutibacter sp.]MCF6181434.1 LysM peptidoglycan-binding domain-containing protein [Lutibacter sp.]
MKQLVYILFLCFFYNGFAQVKKDTLKIEKIENLKEISSKNDTIFKQVKDSLAFKTDTIADKIDSLWLHQLINSPLNDTIKYVLTGTKIVVSDLVDLPTDTLKKRLKILDAKSPFHIEYNPQLESIIKTYLKRRKGTFANLLEKARYYFPLFEEQLSKYDIPLEVKYLAIVESALNPRARSKVGAAGLWQFMYQTGKQYHLNVSSYVDERYDPYRETVAACKYLKNLYQIFGDWDLALAAYNSGPGNVSKAIRKSGGSKNYWNIRHNLPMETAGYLPAFYATLYIFEYANEHQIKAKKTALAKFETDTVQVKRLLTFAQISQSLGIDIKILQFLNPQYKLDIIPYIKRKNYMLTLPIKYIGKFVSNEHQIYALAKIDDAKREKPLPKYFEMNQRIRYRVRNGDFLGKIANRYGVSVRSIKKWNRLRSSRLRIGQRLSIYPRRLPGISRSKIVKKHTRKSTPKGKYQIYTVKNGDSLWLIAQKFSNVSAQNIKDWNNIWSVKSLKPGMKLKIYNL